ncbi:MAG: TonB-dependent receptor, partial [bacterium]|nr:TonB-dependent receptor [bacterium]
EVKISAAQTTTSDVALPLGEVTDQIVVTGEIETISTTETGAATYTQAEVEQLAVSRSLEQAALLAPGVSATGPGDNVTIAGAMSFENLWLINGVVINENIRGQSLPLFIEDAVQETTTSVSGISAEYGRFTGGVVSAITKSGGNELSGSLRVNFTNDDWQARTPLSGERADQIDKTYEGTLGGAFWKDHLWFFTAGRDRSRTGTSTTQSLTNITYPTSSDQRRLEGKLTLTPAPSHSVIGSYLEIDQSSTGSAFGRILDLDSVNDHREDPQQIQAINYTGILTSNLFIEAQYSERDYIIGRGSGGVPDLIEGTLMRTLGTSYRYHAPTFCGSCEDEQRDNENLLVKGSYFLSTESAGSHDIVIGYDTFDDIRFVVNHQTGSDWTVYGSDFIIDANNNVYPVIADDRVQMRWMYVLNLDIKEPTSFKTNSFYVNDRWQLNDRWSFNLGVRYDENDGIDSSGTVVADDRKISPRLGLNWDVKGDGDLLVNASYGTYVAALANNRSDVTSDAGAITSFRWYYGGAPLNTDPSCAERGDCLTTAEVLSIMFGWYESLGGTFDSPFNVASDADINDWARSVSIPGSTSQILETMKSPSVDEFTLGVNKRLGSKGSVRADLVLREWTDFYSNQTTLESGTVEIPSGLDDLTVVGNYGNDVLERKYLGLHTQARYRFTDRLTLAANYTLSKLEGNINGETSNSGPVTSSPNNYPEYKDPSWAYPVGALAADQRHRFRGWAIYKLFDTEHHSFSVSLLQSFWSGTPYGAGGAVETGDYVGDIGYEDPPDDVTYWFTARDAYHTENITRSDLSFNYAFRWHAFGKAMEVFIQPEVINVFNEHGVTAVNDDTYDATNRSSYDEFNPFTETPVEGVHWDKRSGFGQPTDEDDYQTPRTFRFSVGFRF